MPSDPPDVNERVGTEWVAETTPFERVRESMKRTYDPRPVSEIAERARTSETTARKHLRHLTEDGFLSETTSSKGRGVRYARSNESLVLEQANRLRAEVDASTLAAWVAEMQRELREYRETFDAGSPDEAVLAEAEIDGEEVRAWRTTRRNLNFARVALAVNDAERDLRTPEAP